MLKNLFVVFLIAIVTSSFAQNPISKQKDSAMQYMFWFLQNKEMHVASSAYEFSHYKI